LTQQLVQQFSGRFFSDRLLGPALGLLLLALADSFSWLCPGRGVLKPFCLQQTDLGVSSNSLADV